MLTLEQTSRIYVELLRFTLNEHTPSRKISRSIECTHCRGSFAHWNIANKQYSFFQNVYFEKGLPVIPLLDKRIRTLKMGWAVLRLLVKSKHKKSQRHFCLLFSFFPWDFPKWYRRTCWSFAVINFPRKPILITDMRARKLNLAFYQFIWFCSIRNFVSTR